MKFYRVKYQNKEKLFMSGTEVSLLQKSGGSIKILRKATKDEYEKQENNGGE